MKITLAQQQSKLLALAESLFQASLVLDLIDDEGFSDEDGCDLDEDEIMDVLELTAFEWTKIAMIHDVRWTAWTIQYIFLKSQDFFLIFLQAPDRYFHKMFQSVQF
jgi:hypothetical protein